MNHYLNPTQRLLEPPEEKQYQVPPESSPYSLLECRLLLPVPASLEDPLAALPTSAQA